MCKFLSQADWTVTYCLYSSWNCYISHQTSYDWRWINHEHIQWYTYLFTVAVSWCVFGCMHAALSIFYMWMYTQSWSCSSSISPFLGACSLFLLVRKRELWWLMTRLSHRGKNFGPVYQSSKTLLRTQSCKLELMFLYFAVQKSQKLPSQTDRSPCHRQIPRTPPSFPPWL